MEEQTKTLQLSPNPNIHHHRMLLYGLGAILLIVIAFSAGYLLGTKNTQLVSQSKLSVPVVSQVTSTPPMDGSVVNWQTYTSSNMKFSVQYPNGVIPQESGNCTDFSDIPNPRATASAILKKGHTYFDICIVSDDMPTVIPYDSTMEPKNASQQQYSINGYSGLRATRATYLMQGNVEIIYLQNPNGGYAEIHLNAGTPQIFNTMLSTFKFIDINHGKIKIMQGNVYFLSGGGKQQLMANKDDFTQNYYAPPIVFTNALLSPDQSKVLLFAQGGITSKLLSYTNLDSISIKYIHTASQAIWSHNSRYIAYTSKVADAGGDYYFGVYDTSRNKDLNLATQPNIQGTLAYSIVGWQDDDSGIKVHYVAQTEIPYGEVIGDGTTVIPLTSFATTQ